MAPRGAIFCLLVFSAFGFWTLWGFPYNNNLLRYLGDLSDTGASIPGPIYAPMKQHYTGIKIVDKQLTTLVGFFYTAIDGNRADISLTFLNLGSQVLAAWILITTESYRAGNSNNLIITSITFFGLSVAIVGYACVAPIWFMLHLALSKTVSHPTEYNLVMAQPARLSIAPLATMIGFGVPSAVMALPAPSVLSFETKQLWTGIQQFWPVWIYLTQKALETVVSMSDPMAVMLTDQQKKEKTVKYMRRAYIVALASSAGAHLAFVTAGLVAFAFPSVLTPKYSVQLQPDNLFVPPNPFGDEKATSLPNGALWFLQWDLIIGVTATMIWGIAVRLSAIGSVRNLSAWLSALVKYGFYAAVVGPSGAAVIAIWGRDELALKLRTE